MLLGATIGGVFFPTISSGPTQWYLVCIVVSALVDFFRADSPGY